MSTAQRPAQWERMMDRYEFYSVHAINTKNFTYLHNLSALQTLSEDDHRSDLNRVGHGEYAAFLDNMNVRVCMFYREAMMKYKGVVDENMANNMDRDGWEDLLLDLERKAAAFIAEKLALANREARHYVAKVPAESRWKVLSVYLEGASMAALLLHTLETQLERVYSSASDFVDDDDSVLTIAGETIMKTVKSAITSLEKLSATSS